MAVRSRKDITGMQLSGTEAYIFPLIPHVTPIWPLEKRIENMKVRKTKYWRLVRNKMIVFRFLQSINPTITDLFSRVADEDEYGSNIVTLTRNFEEEQRRKHERVYEIQLEAYLRAEKKKNIWDKVQERECATEWRTTRGSLAAMKRNSTLRSQSYRLTEKNRATAKIDLLHQLGVQALNHKEDSTSKKAQQRKFKAQTFRRLKEEFALPVKADEVYLPHIYRSSKGAKRPLIDPRFERLLNSLIPSPNKREKEFAYTDVSGHTDDTEKKMASNARLSGESLHEKWKETMAPNYNGKNVSNKLPNKSKFTRSVAGLWR